MSAKETRWKWTRSVTQQSGEKVVYVGNDEVQKGGVVIKVSARAKGASIEWMPISKKIMTARFY